MQRLEFLGCIAVAIFGGIVRELNSESEIKAHKLFIGIVTSAFVGVVASTFIYQWNGGLLVTIGASGLAGFGGYGTIIFIIDLVKKKLASLIK